MSNLFVWKEQIQIIYARQAKYVDKSLQFILGLFVFGFINANIGFMKAASQPIITVALALICAFLPLVLMVIAAATLILLHLYTLSVPIVIVVGILFLLMFIFYFRLTSKQAIILLLTPLAFAFKIPYIIPIAYGLVGTPIYMVPIACGTMVYYILTYIKASTTTIKSSSADGILGKSTLFAKQILENKEMYVVIIAFTLCLLVVYAIRKLSIDHAWSIAIITGALINVIAIIVGSISLGIKTSYGTLIFGSIVAVLLALALEFFIFAVDYSRTKHLEFEDDEYYYYVKAIPKISVSAPEKTVKRINERQETASVDVAEVKKALRQSNTNNIDKEHEKANDELLEKYLEEELKR